MLCSATHFIQFLDHLSHLPVNFSENGGTNGTGETWTPTAYYGGNTTVAPYTTASAVHHEPLVSLIQLLRAFKLGFTCEFN